MVVDGLFGVVGAKTRPSDHDVTRLLVIFTLVIRDAKERHVGCVVAPRQPGVASLVRIEHAQHAGVGVQHGDAAADLVLGVDNHRQQVCLFAPFIRVDVAEAHLRPGCQVTNDQVCATLLLARLLEALQGDVLAILAERKR